MKENINFNMPSLKLEGKYKVQLFDKNNNLIEEVEGHNCINKALFSTAFSNFIMRGLIDNDCLNNTLYGGKSGSGSTSGLTRWLYLTDSNLAESDDYKNPIIFGETTGFAHSGNATVYDYTKRGIINKNECVTVNNYLEGGSKIKSKTSHLVWDFATDKGNGNFNNIYLRCNNNLDDDSMRNNDNIDEYRNHKVSIGSMLLNSKDSDLSLYYKFYEGGSISHDDDCIYIQTQLLALSDNNSSHPSQNKCYDTILRIKQSNWAIDDITLNVPSDYSEKQAYIIQGGGYFWRIEQDYYCTRYNLDGEYIDRINLATSFAGTKVNIPNISDYPANNFHFTGDKDNVYVSYKDSNNDYYVVVFNSSGNKLSETKSNYNNDVMRLGIAYINNAEYLYNSQTGEVFSIINGVLKNVTNTEISYYNFKFDAVSFYSKEGYMFSIGKGNVGYSTLSIYTFVPWTSHIKLDSPITKTSANTMKIQYDITCEYVPVGGIENIE